MKKLTYTSLILAVITLSFSALSCGKNGISNFDVAKMKASQEDKDILLKFVGSDWCPWCKKLEDEVFGTELFQQEVKKHFVILVLDFPQDQSLLSRGVYKQNEKLYRKYGVPGLPTVVLTDAEGKAYAMTGYRQGGPEKYLEHLKQLRKLKP